MAMPTNHRRTVKHYHSPGDLHELTFSCLDRKPLLMDDTRRRLLADSLNRALTNYNFSLVAFVFMPEHVHLLVYPRGLQADMEGFLSAVKRPFSYRVKMLLAEPNDPLLRELTVPDKKRGTTFQFWLKGPGYDRNLNSRKAISASIDYFHRNPVERELCARAIDWKWSSARWHLSEGQIVDPELPRLEKLPAGFLDGIG
jgi:putative transposase